MRILIGLGSGLAALLIWEGACELARQSRWHAEDAHYWKWRVIRAEREEEA